MRKFRFPKKSILSRKIMKDRLSEMAQKQVKNAETEQKPKGFIRRLVDKILDL